MSALQEQDQDRTGAHPVCGEAAVPRAHEHEHCPETLHGEEWRKCEIGQHLRAIPFLYLLLPKLSASRNTLKLFGVHSVDIAKMAD